MSNLNPSKAQRFQEGFSELLWLEDKVGSCDKEFSHLWKLKVAPPDSQQGNKDLSPTKTRNWSPPVS